GDGEAAVATGYLARNWYALNPNQWMRDIVEHTGKAFLGLTFNCAHCHDHKYDPISHEDYFRLRAFFEPLGLRQDRWPGEPDAGPFQKYEYSVLRKIVMIGSVSVFDERPDAETIMYLGGDERSPIEGRGPVAPGVPAALGGPPIDVRPVELPPDAWYPGAKAFIRQAEIAQREQAVRAAEAALAALSDLDASSVRVASVETSDPIRQKAIAAAAAKLDAARSEMRSIEARIAADDARHVRQSDDAPALAAEAHRAERESALAAARAQLAQAEHALAEAEARPPDADKRAEAIQAAAAQVAATREAVTKAEQALDSPGSSGDDYTPLSPTYPRQSTGLRRALAEWITCRENPLTARVAVNHIWSRHFARPLVATVADFGRNGAPPTHPELLDWLAVELMDHGWEMKHLHRLIVTSTTYCQSSKGRESRVESRERESSGASRSPNGLVVSTDRDNGLLSRYDSWRMQAEVVRDAVLHAAGQLDTRFGGPPLDNVTDAASRRRALYFSVFPEAGGSQPFLQMFDPPDPCDCYRRSETVVPQQALAMTNSPLVLNQSRLLARRLTGQIQQEHTGQTVPDDVFAVAAFEQILTRRPTARELSACREFLAKQAALLGGGAAATATGTTPDGAIGPAADASLRARESLIRALFSHNDFLMVR
ncbi:MAG TPA: DUF1553 domain-containing protein, partial [Planctomycetaceae bacterium]|nr:DUF1553 domain-containing protein [Planctomycetaceae bacterium]